MKIESAESRIKKVDPGTADSGLNTEYRDVLYIEVGFIFVVNRSKVGL